MHRKLTQLFARTAVAAGLFAVASLPALSANINFHDLFDGITVDATQFDVTPATVTHMNIFGGEDDVRVHGQFISNSADGSGDSFVGLVEPGIGCSLTQNNCFSDILHVFWTVNNHIADFTADFGSDPESLGTCVQCTSLFEDGTLQNVNAFLILPDNITIQIQSDLDVPEPASLALLGLGLFGVAALRRKPQQ